MRQRPIGVRTRVFAAIGVLWGVWLVIIGLRPSSSIVTLILGPVFIIIAGYWLFARDKSE
jgi:hypothetical protein